MEQNVMTMWEVMIATVPATAVGVAVLAIVIGSINKRIDDTNNRIDKGFDDLKNDVNKRIDDLRELFMMVFGDEIRKAKFKKTGSDK